MNDQLRGKSAVQLASGTAGTNGAGARSIYAALRAQILDGTYAPGASMPSTRALASELGVARSTVTSAYEQLLSEGFIESRQGARTRVAHLRPMELELKVPITAPGPPRRLSAYGERLRAMPAPERRDRSRLVAEFRYGDLAGADFPTLAWKKAVNAAVSQRPARLAYGDPHGSLRLRHALQAYLWRARGIRCDPDQVIVVSGSQQGLDLCARLLLDAGDRFVMENPGYAKAQQVFAATGAAAMHIPVDGAGMDTSLLAGAEARLAYVTPSHQYPLGGVMPIARRRELLAWAQAAEACVIEDDYDSEYRYDIKPVPPLYGLGAPGTVIYLGTVSKTLSPTLRLGYLVVPSVLQESFAAAKDLADRHTSMMAQDALAALLEGGGYERHVRAVRRRNGERRSILLDTLRRSLGERIGIEGAEAGLHLVAWLRDVPRSAEGDLIDAARALGLGLYPVSPLFHADHPARPDRAGLVLGYAALDPARIKRGVTLLGKAIAAVTATPPAGRLPGAGRKRPAGARSSPGRPPRP